MTTNTSCQRIIHTIETVLKGKRAAVELALCAFLADGHLLIEDVPGTGKTTLAKAMVKSFGGAFSRIQFTADLLPSDIIGVSVFDAPTGSFRFREGPVFANLVLADEINRASPKTQSALLEAMSEQQVSVDGATRPLPSPFMVIATQNGRDNFGTYPLPESQLDRFTMRISLGYADLETERTIVSRRAVADATAALTPAITSADVAALKQQVEKVRFDDSLVDYILRIVAATRDNRLLSCGVGPRGGIALHRCARALAVIRGRDFALPDDVKNLCVPVLAHRVVTENAAARGSLSERIIADIVNAVEVPV